MHSNMGPKTTPSLISKGGDEIDTPWEIGLDNFHVSYATCSSLKEEFLLKTLNIRVGNIHAICNNFGGYPLPPPKKT